MNNEFTKIKSGNYVRYVLEDGGASSGGTSSGSVASMDMPIGKDQIVVQSRMGPKEPPKPRNFVAKNAKMGGAGKMKDKSKTLPRHEKHKKPVAEALGMENPDHEASMARNELYRNAKYGIAMLKMIEPGQQLEGWVESCLTKAASSLDKIYHYLDYETKFGQGVDHSNEEPEVDVDEDAGEADMARENLMLIVEYSTKLFKMIKDGDDLEGWVFMKLTKASECVSSAKHHLEYEQFKNHGIDDEYSDEQPVAEGYSSNRGYQHGFASPTAPRLGSRPNHGDDERHDLDDVELQRNRQEVTSYNITIDGKPINPKPIFGRSATIAWGKEQAAAGVDLSNAMISPVREGVAESQQLSVQQLATISDEALDNEYHYGRSSPGNTFGWQANLKSAEYAKQMIDAGVTDIEKISDAIHKGWNVTAQAFVQNPDQFDDTAKLKAAGKLEAKLQQRAQLMKQNYAQLPDDEKEKDRVVARAMLQALKGGQGVAEAASSGHAKLAMLKAQYNEILKSANPNMDRLRRIRDQIIKLKFDLGLSEGVAEGKDPTTDSAQDARGSHRGEVKKNKDGSYVATNQAGSRKIFKSEQAAKAHADSGEQGVAEGFDKLTPQQKAHEYNLDAAQRELDRRHERGEDMTGAKIDKKTYKIVKPKQQGVAEGDYNDYLAGMLENVLAERSKSKAQWDLMHAVAHNPQFANQVKIKPSVGQEFSAADAGHERSALPDRVLKTKSKKK